MQPTEFLATADLLPEPMLLVSLQGAILSANKSFIRVCGLEREAVSAYHLTEIVSDPSRRITDYLRTCARSDHMVLGSLTLKEGTYRCDGVGWRSSQGEPTASVLLRLRGKPEVMEGFLTPPDRVDQLDLQMSRREKVEDALRRQKETLEVTLASIGDAVVVTNSHGAVTFMNVVAEALTGWTLAAASGRSLPEVFHIINEYTRNPVDDPVAKVLETGGIVGLANHTILLSRDGREIPIDDSAAPIRKPTGELFGVVLIFRDISEQKKAEHAQAWLAAIVDSSDDAIVSKTLDGIITSWNRGAARLFGYSAEEIVGQPITTIIPPELRSEERQILARLHAGQSIDHFDTVRVGKDGKHIDISLTVSPIRDPHGFIVGASKIARDVSERKRVERAVRDSDRRKDEFLATLAHELRNPLAPIRNATELLARLPLDPAARSATEIIDRQVSLMSHLVDDLLDVSRITAGRVRLQKEPFDLWTAVAIAIETSRPALQAANHELISVKPSAALYVHGDRVRLSQVFSNILNNAIKYTEPGGRIEISATREEGNAVVRIRDNGIGIPASMLNYVFELFAQINRSYERTGGGLGLGLSLAKRLVEMHDGHIEARSGGPSQGSEFIIRLAAIEFIPAATVEVVSHQRTPRGVRILIADDNHDAAMSLSMLLEMMGHETTVVHDGLAAIEAAETLRPKVVILDIGMPHLDGYATVQRLIAQPWAAGTLFVALTGWGREGDRQKALDAGFSHHLVKPVDLDAMSSLIDDAFRV